jgi:pyridoxal phosphate enzyme (YggS family)
VERRIRQTAERSGRDRSAITLVAVTKKFSAAYLHTAYEAGLRDFGENYVQEFQQKKPQLASLVEARYHLIGHLQSNKARAACELFHIIQTVDSPRLLERLDAAAAERGSPVDALLEVKLSPEQSKTGAAPEDLPALIKAIAACRHITVSGLMTVPPWNEDPEQSRPYFRRLAALARDYGFVTLSMGMSADLEVAIEEGATIVRIGTALFGARPKPQ